MCSFCCFAKDQWNKFRDTSKNRDTTQPYVCCFEEVSLSRVNGQEFLMLKRSNVFVQIQPIKYYIPDMNHMVGRASTAVNLMICNCLLKLSIRFLLNVYGSVCKFSQIRNT